MIAETGEAKADGSCDGCFVGANCLCFANGCGRRDLSIFLATYGAACAANLGVFGLWFFHIPVTTLETNLGYKLGC
jgi:hypothetical protein